MLIKGAFLLSICLLFTLQSIEANNLSSVQQYYRVSAEKVPEPPKKVSRKSRLVAIVKNIVDEEVKRLENSITDSVMEEVISYYGQRLEAAESMKNDVIKLSDDYNQLNRTISKLDSNYQFIEKNQQNLVNTVRDSMTNAKRLREKYLKLKYAKMRKQIRNKSFVKNRDLNSELKTTLATTQLTPLQPEALKQQLIKDLETKYSSLIGNSLTNAIVKNLNEGVSSNSDSEGDVDKEEEEDIDLNDKKELVVKSIPNGKLKNKFITLYFALIFQFISDCQDLRNDGFTKDGVYKVFTKHNNHSFDVFCEFEDNIGWTVLQRRHNGAVDFNQNWNTYKEGFGNIFESHEFWLGLEKMHSLTNQFDYS